MALEETLIFFFWGIFLQWKNYSIFFQGSFSEMDNVDLKLEEQTLKFLFARAS